MGHSGDMQKQHAHRSAKSERDMRFRIVKTFNEGGPAQMLLALLLLLLLILVFGGLGIFVAKVFLIALAVVVLLTLFTGGSYYRNR